MNALTKTFAMLLCAASVLPVTAIEESTLLQHYAHQEAFAGPRELASGRHYAPSREIDLRHLSLDVTPNFKQRSIVGTAVLRFAPIASALAQLKLDAVRLQVASVDSSEKIQAWQATDTQIIVTFADPIPADREATVTVHYSATPDHGLYFRTAEMGYPASDANVWTQGEPTEARHWFPSFDAPNEKFTSDVTCRVPEDMTVLSNGHLVSSTVQAATGLKAVKWLQDKPHSNYLIALAAGYLKGMEDKYRDLPIALYTPASQIENAKTTFEGTKEMLAFFEEEIGVPYPWDKYYQVCVSDYHWGGMENTSLTILNEGTLHPEGFETLRNSGPLVAHELAHQWFGDLVTCKDWSHLWLNEGFATYYETLYAGHKHGRDELLYSLYQSAKGITAVPDDNLPIVHRTFGQPEEQFSFRAYPKGGWVLHMLRSQLGADLYRKCIKTYLERHRFGNVETADLAKVIEELSGRSFDQFFDQYVFHAQQPDFTVGYEWLEKEKLARISVTQNQKTNEQVLLFRVPVTVRFRSAAGVVDRELLVQKKSEDFYVPLPQAPEMVRFDPEFTVLCKVSFELPLAMLHRQLAEPSDVIGRLEAIQQLAKRKEAATVEKLKTALNSDSFYGVRLEASKALRQIDTLEAQEALKASRAQPDARVRLQVLNDCSWHYQEASLGVALETLATEKNPDIQAGALRILGGFPRSEVREKLLTALKTPSYRAILADAALASLRLQDDPSAIPAVLDAVKANETVWPTGVLVRGVETLAYLGRTEERKDAVVDALARHLESNRPALQQAAIRSLGVLGDPKAIALLTRFTTLSKDAPTRPIAEAAVNSLRAGKKPSVEFGDVRNEVLLLQQDNKELKKEMEALKKKLEAVAPTPSAIKKETSKPSEKPAKRRP